MAATSAAMDGVAAAALRSVFHRVRQAAERCGRAPEQIRVVAVSKTKPVPLLREVYEAGHRCFGENYVQEILEKAPQLPEDIEWHFIGHLQSNKVKPLLASVPNLTMVETVDDEKIANRLDSVIGSIGRKPLKVMVQVNTSGEESKYGVEPSGCVDLAKHVKLSCPNLEFCGLMTIGMLDYTSTPENFKTLAKCRTEVCNALGIPEEQCELSMGMSGDFELARDTEVGMYRYKPPFFNALKQPPAKLQVAAAKPFCSSAINRLSSQGSHREVLLRYSSLLKHNTPPDAFTFPSLLKACASLRLISQGLCLHHRAVLHGYSSDPYVASSLINMYAKFGYSCYARKVFDLMPERNVFSCTAVIGCYSSVGDVGSAFCVYNEMVRQGIRPTSVSLLGLLSGVSELAHVQCLHGCALLYGFESDLNLVNSLLCVYGRYGMVEDVRRLFESMGRRDVVSWNSLVSGYARIGNLREILLLLKRMVSEGMGPDLKTYGSVVSASAILGKLDLAKLVHQMILRAGFILDRQIETSLIAMYLKCGDVDYAFQIFQQAREKDVVLWTAMISGLVQNDCADKALMVFRCMLRSGMMPSTTTIASLLAACAQIGSFDLGASIHGYVVRQRMELGISAQNSFVTMYAKCGRLEQSYAVFDMMEQKDLVSWNAIVSGYSQNGYLSKAFLLFSEMRSSLQIPDSVTLVSLLQACASTGALHQGKWIHNFIIRSCHEPCILVDTALLDMYSKCGDLHSAQKCFNGMSQQDLVSWSTIIAGYGTHGKGDIALSMYSKFLHSGIKPNHVICLSALSACSHNGLVEQGLSLFQSMTETLGIEPKLEHLSCIVDLLSRAGRVEEAYKFYKNMFPEPSIDTLGILLDACRANGNEELGEVISRDIIMLKPVNSGNFVQLANSYAAMNRWGSVGKAWTAMNSLGLKKLPGWSFVELHGSIETFFMNHGSHPRLDDEMLVSKTLRWEMTNLTIDRTDQRIGSGESY